MPIEEKIMEETKTVIENEVRVSAEPAETVYISTKKYSYGIFCFNDSGDLFLNSDYGMYGFAWRHYGKEKPFKNFLANTNADYIFDKFDTNVRYLHSRGLPKHVRGPVTGLIQALIDHLKKEIASQP